MKQATLIILALLALTALHLGMQAPEANKPTAMKLELSHMLADCESGVDTRHNCQSVRNVLNRLN